ncbi:hypothetical protein Tco_1401293 [Tanacetum coccineum]
MAKHLFYPPRPPDINDVNSRTKKPKVVPISTRKPKSQANKSVATYRKKTVASESTITNSKSYYRMLYEKTSKAWKWWIEQQCPSGYKWVPKTKMNGCLKIGMKVCKRKPRSSMFKRRLIIADQASVFMAMTSDHNRSELGIQDHSNEQSSSKLVPKSCSLIKQDSYIMTRVRITILPSHSNAEDNRWVKVRKQSVIQPVTEDLPKDNPKIEIAVLSMMGDECVEELKKRVRINGLNQISPPTQLKKDRNRSIHYAVKSQVDCLTLK